MVGTFFNGEIMGKEENVVSKAIKKYLLDQGWMVVRVNSGMCKGYVWMVEWVPPPSLVNEMLPDTLNSAELIAWYQENDPPHHSGFPDQLAFRQGFTLAIEDKTKTGKAGMWQKIFMKYWEQLGFVGFIPQGYEDFVNQYKAEGLEVW